MYPRSNLHAHRIHRLARSPAQAQDAASDGAEKALHDDILQLPKKSAARERRSASAEETTFLAWRAKAQKADALCFVVLRPMIGRLGSDAAVRAHLRAFAPSQSSIITSSSDPIHRSNRE